MDLAETLLEDATRFAAVAGAADVPASLEIWPRLIDAWRLWNARGIVEDNATITSAPCLTA